jgi:hypothetical protein
MEVELNSLKVTAADVTMVDTVVGPSDSFDVATIRNGADVASIRAAVQPIAPGPTSTTSPLGALNLKPGSGPLAPSRTPAPMAIVGGLRMNAEAPPSRPSANRPTPSRSPTNDVGFAPPPPPSAPALPRGSVPPPAGGPPASYERAFRQWSSPSLPSADDPSGTHGPVTFQVYTPQDISRGPMRSIASMAAPPKKASVGVRIGLALVGGLVVLLTAAAVIAVSTDEPKRPVAAASAIATGTATQASAPPPPAVPSVISIGDPADDAPPAPIAATSSKPKPKQPVLAVPVPLAPTPNKTSPSAPTSTTPAAPASLKGLAPPPNPYGK